MSAVITQLCFYQECRTLRQHNGVVLLYYDKLALSTSIYPWQRTPCIRKVVQGVIQHAMSEDRVLYCGTLHPIVVGFLEYKNNTVSHSNNQQSASYSFLQIHFSLLIIWYLHTYLRITRVYGQLKEHVIVFILLP